MRDVDEGTGGFDDLETLRARAGQSVPRRRER